MGRRWVKPYETWLAFVNFGKGSAKDNLEELEDFCSSFDAAFSQILLAIVERTILAGVSDIFAPSLYKLAQNAKLTVYCFIGAWLALNEDNPTQAIALCDLAPQKSGDIYGLKGQACLDAQHYRRAHQAFVQSTRLAPLDPVQWFWLAKSSYALANHEEAWQAASKCHDLAPQNLEAVVLMSIIARSTKEASKINQVWSLLWSISGPSIQSAPVLITLLELALSLEDSRKLEAILEQTALESLSPSKELAKKLPPLLRELEKDCFVGLKPKALDTLAKVFSPDEPRSA